MKVNKTFYCLIIIIVTTIAYWNSFDVPFHFDDQHVIRDNPGIRDLSNFGRVFNSYPHRPVAQLTFALNYHFHELDVWGYHLVNLIIHIINALLVFWLVLQILNRLKGQKRISLQDPEILFVAFSTGLLFAVHPVQTQAVTYIVQRMASLATLFYLLAVNCFLKGRSILSKKKFAWIWFVLSGLSGLLGLFTKQIVFTFPIMILMLEWVLYDDIGTFLKKNKKKAIIIGVIFLSFLLILPLVYKLDLSKIFKTIPPEQGHTYTLTPYNYFLTQLRVHMTYLRLIFLPVNQHLDYDYPISESLFEWKVILSGLFLLTLFILAVRYRKKYPVFTIGVLWYFIASAVESSIIPIPNVIFEHRLYLPIIGISFIIIITIAKIRNYNNINSIIILITILLYMTNIRNNIWKSSLSLWENSYYLANNKARTNINYGNVLISNKDYLEAYIIYNNAHSINKNYKLIYQNNSNLKLITGDIQSIENNILDTYKGKLSQIKFFIERNMEYKAEEILYSINIDDIKNNKPYSLLLVSNKLNKKIYNKLYEYSDSLNLLTTEEKYRLLLLSDTLSISKFYKDRKFLSKETIAEVYYKIAINYVNDNNYEKAIEFINEALEYINDPRFYHFRGRLFYNKNNFEYAIYDFTSAFSLSNNIEFIKLRAKCYQLLGKKENVEYDLKYYEAIKAKNGQKQEL